MDDGYAEEASRRRGGVPGGLVLVATPIGSARDITLRALDALGSADIIAAEDTRAARRLMNLHGVAVSGRPVVAYHDHSGPADRERLVNHMRKGRTVAYVSEAGMPLVADPGFALVRAAREAGLPVTVAPGASAVLAGLVLSGLPSDRFLFAGFLPQPRGPRRQALTELAPTPATLVFFESPHRVAKSLGDMSDVLGPERPAALCREITKRFEEVRRGTLAELARGVAEAPPKGEIVIVVDRAPAAAAVDDAALRAALSDEMRNAPLGRAAGTVAKRFGVSRKRVYALGLEGG